MNTKSFDLMELDSNGVKHLELCLEVKAWGLMGLLPYPKKFVQWYWEGFVMHVRWE